MAQPCVSTRRLRERLLFKQQGHAEAVRALMGLDVHAQAQEGYTALSVAGLCGRVEVAKVLVELGANVNYTQTHAGFTAMHLAAQEGHAALVSAFCLTTATSPPNAASASGQLILADDATELPSECQPTPAWSLRPATCEIVSHPDGASQRKNSIRNRYVH